MKEPFKKPKTALTWTAKRLAFALIICLSISCSAQSTAYTPQGKPDTLIQITPLQGRHIIQTYDELQAARRLQAAYQKALEDCQLNELRLAQSEYEQQQVVRFLRKKLLRANLEKWGWRVLATATFFITIIPK